MPAFAKETFAFLRDLEANNSKEWFDANRDRYEAHWRAPALAFIETIAPRMAALDPPLKAEPKLNGSLRRINRDVRFSKDKTPYNPSLHMIFWAGDHPNRSPGMHFVLHPDGVGYGAGMWGFQGATLEAWRDLVTDPVEGKRVAEAVHAAEAIGCTLGEPDLARVPGGRAGEGLTAELLRHKSFVLRTHGKPVPPSSLTEDWAMEMTTALLPAIRLCRML